MLTWKKAFRKLSVQSGIPFDYCVGEFSLELFGNHSLTIGCHQGISAYDPNHIVIVVDSGSVDVSGDHLTLDTMNHHSVTLSGRIDAIRLVH